MTMNSGNNDSGAGRVKPTASMAAKKLGSVTEQVHFSQRRRAAVPAPENLSPVRRDHADYSGRCTTRLVMRPVAWTGITGLWFTGTELHNTNGLLPSMHQVGPATGDTKLNLGPLRRNTGVSGHSRRFLMAVDINQRSGSASGPRKLNAVRRNDGH